MSLNGKDIITGGNIIIPIDMRTDATTISIIRNGMKIKNPISNARVRDRVFDFHTISNYRYGGRICPHVDGYDDVTPRNDIFAVQAHIFCFGRRLVFGCWKLGSKLRRIIATLFYILAACCLCRLLAGLLP